MGSNTININDGVETKTLDLEVLDSPPSVPSSGYTRIFNESGNYQSIDSNGIISPLGGAPSGAVMAYMGVAAPVGWEFCLGQALSRTNYAALFAAIGVSCGEGDGSTTFNLPDLRGRFLRGVDETANRDLDKATRTAMTTGGNTGNNVGSVQADEFKTHTHPLSGRGNIAVNNGAYSLGQVFVSSDDTGWAGGNETRPINAYVNWIIKT